MWLIESLATRLDLLLAGLAGGFVGAYWYKELTSVKSKIYFVMCGGLSGMYAAPFAFDYFKMAAHSEEASKNALAFIALMIGIFGPKAIQSILTGLEKANVLDVLKSTFWEVIKAIANRKGQ